MNLYVYVGGDPVNWIDPGGLHRFLPIGGRHVIPTGACHSGDRPNIYINFEGGVVATGGLNNEVCCDGEKKILIKTIKVCSGVARGFAISFTQDLTEIPKCSGKKVGDVYYGTETGGSYYIGGDISITFPESGPSCTVSPGLSFGWFVKNTACRYEVISVKKIGCCN